ncbi:MAG: D-alanyl-D-alanine carboxypeptidase family protein [bacterium]
MKILLFIMTLFSLSITTVYAISASSYVVIDQNSNRVLYGSNYNDQSLIASITKILTAIVVIENCDIDEVIVVGEEVLSAYGSAVYIEVGEEISVRDLLYGLMLRSGNDAAIVLAHHVSGSIEEFAILMNELVDSLGLKNSIFYNPSGLDEETENLSTAYDMAVITSYAMKNEDYFLITSTDYHTTKTNYKTYWWDNKNRLLGTNEYTTGGKTGYTEKAKRTLVTTASYNNMDIVVVTLNDGNDFEDHASLYNTVFSNYESIKVVDKDLTSYVDSDNKYYVNNDYYALIKEEDSDNLIVKTDFFTSPVGNVGGLIKVYYTDDLLYEDNLYIEEKEVKISFWEKIVGWLKLW